MQVSDVNDLYFTYLMLAFGFLWIAAVHNLENRDPAAEARIKARKVAFEAKLRDLYHIKMRIDHALSHYSLHPTDDKTLRTLRSALSAIEIHIRHRGPEFFGSDVAVDPERILAEFDSCITTILERPSLKLVRKDKEVI